MMSGLLDSSAALIGENAYLLATPPCFYLLSAWGRELYSFLAQFPCSQCSTDGMGCPNLSLRQEKGKLQNKDFNNNKT
jgi:hypothetical protein